MQARFSPVASLFPVILVGLLAGMTYWLDITSRKQDASADGLTRHDPDYYVERFEVRRFDKEGRLQHTLRAERMSHFPDDDSTLVLAPHLTYHRAQPTRISAREALVGSKGEHVQLTGDVRVTRDGAGGKPATVLATERLEAFPDDEIARTEAPVQITQGQSQVTGNALNADNLNARYVLEGPVRGVFFRQGKQPPVAAAVTPATTAPRSAATTAPKPAAKPKAAAKPKPKPKPKPKAKTRAKS